MEYSALKILITGATGYIGGKAAVRLNEEGYYVTCMTRNNQPCNDLLTVEGNLLKPETLFKATFGMDIVIHFAGALGRGLTDEMIHSVNVEGVKNLILAAKKNKVEYFLHISSGAVTGPLGPKPANEDTECKPYTIYEKTKLEGERLALSLSNEINLPLGIVRPTFTYGPGDPHKLLMFKLIKKGLFFFIGDGKSTNHPVYIDDLINGILLMIKKRPSQEIYILGGPRPVSKMEWAMTIANELGVRQPFVKIPAGLSWAVACIMESIGSLIKMNVPITRSRVLAMSKYWGMDISKAERELGYSPQIDLKEGIADTVAWYREEGWL